MIICGIYTIDMSKISEDIKDHLPYYLSKEAKDGILKALKDFPEKLNYYTIYHQNDFLQGDGWDSLDVVNIEHLEKKATKGILLSNSCDISVENTRALPARVVFAPIIPLKKYENLLQQKISDQASITAKMDAIKRQHVTSIFYLPKGGSLAEDYIALLDDLHNLPINSIAENKSKYKYFTLSQVGFFMFLLKLSIHFCRFHENVLRDQKETVAPITMH